GPVLPRTRDGFRPVRREDVLLVHVVVLEEAIGGLGLRPLATRLIDRTLRHRGKLPAELEESGRPSFIPQVHAPSFLPSPIVVAARLHPASLESLAQRYPGR